MDNFYVTLPSSVRSTYFTNTLADYVTHLPRAIELDGAWEVALVELSFTKSWYNVNTPQEVGIRINVPGSRSYIKDLRILPGRYSIADLILNVNTMLAAHSNEYDEVPIAGTETKERVKRIIRELNSRSIISAPYITVNKVKRKAVVTFGLDSKGSLVIPVMGDELRGLLGFSLDDEKDIMPDPTDVHRRITKETERAYDIEAGIYAVYIYSDIVKPNLIGDTSARCLRVVSIPSERSFGENCSMAFVNPSYLEVSNRRFKNIHVTLKDKTNENIPFQFGETLLKLHFRKKYAV